MERLPKRRMVAEPWSRRTGLATPSRPMVGRWLAVLRTAVAAGMDRLLCRPRLWIEHHRARDELAKLDDRMLRDMGVTRYDIAGETKKPFWRA